MGPTSLKCSSNNADGITSYLTSYELTDKNVILSFVKIELQVMY